MSIKIELVRKPYGFRPLSAFDEEAISHVRTGTVFSVKLVRAQSDQQRKFFFAMIAELARALGRDPGELRKEITIRAGRIDNIRFERGEIAFEAKSMTKMDGYELASFVEAAQALIVSDYLTPLEGTAFFDRIWGMIAPQEGP